MKQILIVVFATISLTTFGQVELIKAEKLASQNDFFKVINILENQSGIDSEEETNRLLLLADSYLKIGRNDLALESLQLAEKQVTPSTLLAADCFEDLGVIYWNNGNKVTALSYHEKALEIKKKLLQSNDTRIADSYNNIGLIYIGSEFLQAIIYFDRALKIYEQNLGSNDPKVAVAYSNLAFANSGQKNYGDAIRYLERVDQIWEANFEGDHPNKAYALSNKGLIYKQQGDIEKAVIHQKQALEQYRRLYGSKHPEIANTLYLLGDLAMEKNEFKEAIDWYQQSIYANLIDQDYGTIYDLPEPRDFYNVDILLTSLQAKAKALEALHFERTLRPRDLKAVLTTYELADVVISKIRQLRKNEADKLRLGNLATELYEKAIQTALTLSENTFQTNSYLEKAYGFCERSKSAILLEAISETNAKHFAGIPDHLIELEDSLKVQINYIEQQLAQKSGSVETLKSSLFRYEQAYRSFISNIEKEYPEYYNLKFNQQLATVTDIQNQLDESTVILSYFVGKSHLYIFQISKGSLKVIQKVTTQSLLPEITGYRNAIKYRVDAVYEKQATLLYELLIPSITKFRSAVILPDGVLGTVPYEALVNPKTNKKLIEELSISYDYSATLWLNRSRKTASEEVEGIMLNAPISFEKNEIRMANLPGSENEVQEIKYLFLGTEQSPTVNLQANASEWKVKSTKLSSYKYLHFATHGIVNESKPQLSRIFLSPESGEDGSLYSGEIYNLKINADLVTLSACETGLGKVEKGEGVMGLSRALMYAGAKNLVVSLWKVADQSTAQLMIEFYKQHLHHSDNHLFGDDLRKAKLSLIRSEDYHQPYYWAPFILVGF